MSFLLSFMGKDATYDNLASKAQRQDLFTRSIMENEYRW